MTWRPIPVFSCERAQDCFAEAMPLLREHFEEIAAYADIPLDPDFSAYKLLEDAGYLRCYTARIDEQLIGYAVFFVKGNLHYKASRQAQQDILFIQKEHRGFGARFILWCDEQLKQDGAVAVHHHLKAKHNFGKLMEKLGYELVDLVYSKRLDK